MWYATTTGSTPQTVTAVSEDPTATVTLRKGVTVIDTDTGGATGSVTLSAGVNTITVTVVVGSETVVYTVEVTKT